MYRRIDPEELLTREKRVGKELDMAVLFFSSCK
jgi:hypothetical protein